MSAERADVIVVGAGLSGLTAALRLRQAGRRPVVLEAGERIGGHARRIDRPGRPPLEAGGEFVGAAQTHVVGLAAELGIGTAEIPPAAGLSVRVYSGRRFEEQAPLAADPEGRRAYLAALARIDELALTFPPGRPWEAPEAAALDALTLAAWSATNVPHPGARAVIDLELALGLSGAAPDVSFLHVLSSVRSAGGTEPLWAEVSSVLESGSSGLCERVAAELDPADLRLGSPVTRIDHGPEGVTAWTPGGSISAPRAILAIAPVLAGAIEFEPLLPLRRRLLQRRWSQAPAFKLFASYPSPWWRDLGLSGTAIGDAAVPVPLVFDASPADGSEGLLVGFANVTAALPEEMLAGPEARAAGMAESLAAYFGERAREGAAFWEGDWSADRWVSGCGSHPGPGALTGFGPALREPIGPLHWAGTETSPRWHSFLEGAVCAGELAAEAVLEQLGDGV